MGGEDLRLVHLELWILMAAFVWTLSWALLPGRRALAWLPAIVVLPILSPVVDNIALGNVDTLVAGFVAAGALFVALWLEDGRPERMILGAVLLAGAATTKNEGLVGSLVVLLLAGIVVLARGRAGWRPWLAGAGIVAFAILPWQLWMAVHDVTNRDVPGLGESLKPSYLSDEFFRVGPSIKSFFMIFGNQGVYLWIMPAFLALVLAVLVLRWRPLRTVAAFYLGAVLLFFASLIFVFWTSRLNLDFQISTSSNRVSMTFMLLALVGLAHVGSSAVRAREATANVTPVGEVPQPALAPRELPAP
jgi:hypothetical protein